MKNAVLLLALGISFSSAAIPSAHAENPALPYAVSEAELAEKLKQEAVRFDWLEKIYDRDNDNSPFDIPTELAHIQKIEKVNEHSIVLPVRFKESVDQINALIQNGIEVFMSFRVERYVAAAYGVGSPPHKKLCEILGKKDNALPILILTMGATPDVIAHESVHVQQMSAGYSQKVIAQLLGIAKVNKATKSDEPLFQGIFSAAVEIPAYETQYAFIQASPVYMDEKRPVAARDGNALLLLPGPKMKENLSKDFGKEIRFSLERINEELDGLKSNRPALRAALCAFLGRNFSASGLFKKDKIFPTCIAL